jgi:hypothetical protein
MKFTPGPWSIVPNIIETEWLITAQRSDACRGYVASTAKTNDESEANARLIAAAPELYEALKEIAEPWIEPQSNPHAFDDLQEIARAALAKAGKGEE